MTKLMFALIATLALASPAFAEDGDNGRHNGRDNDRVEGLQADEGGDPSGAWLSTGRNENRGDGNVIFKPQWDVDDKTGSVGRANGTGLWDSPPE